MLHVQHNCHLRHNVKANTLVSWRQGKLNDGSVAGAVLSIWLKGSPGHLLPDRALARNLLVQRGCQPHRPEDVGWALGRRRTTPAQRSANGILPISSKTSGLFAVCCGIKTYGLGNELRSLLTAAFGVTLVTSDTIGLRWIGTMEEVAN